MTVWVKRSTWLRLPLFRTGTGGLALCPLIAGRRILTIAGKGAIMKINLFILLYLVFTSLALAQTRGPEGDVSLPPTPEENFYEGEQVNSDTFEGPPEDLEQEEALPYDPHEEIYPYENMDLSGDEEYVDEY